MSGSVADLRPALLGQVKPGANREPVLALQTMAVGLHEGDGLRAPDTAAPLTAVDAYDRLSAGQPVDVVRGTRRHTVGDVESLVGEYHQALAEPSLPISPQYLAPMPLQYLHVGTEHFDTYEALDRLCFEHPYPPETLRHYITKANAEAVVANSPGGAIGYYILGHEQDASKIEIVGVTPQAQGQKAGEALLLEAIESARRHGSAKCYLEVEVTNTRAKHLYEKHNFKTVATIPNWISHGRTAYKMELNLQAAG
jgi:ribosomal-protein-alanine N-acetyltransferase